MTSDPIVKACRIAEGVVAVEVFVWDADGCVTWLPSLHIGSVDFDVVESQIRQHRQEVVTDG